MNNIIKKIMFGCLLFLVVISVNAESYSVMTLLPVNSNVTVETDSFTYQDMVFNTTVDDKGYASLSFGQVVNKSKEALPISINVLLFDGNKKNIGYVTYCTNKDYDSDYNRYELAAKEAIPFSIAITPRYFATEKYTENNIEKARKFTVSDVKYIAVQDANLYCKIGGYSKYKGKTLEQIVKKENTSDKANIVSETAKKHPETVKKVIIGIVAVLIIGIVLFIIKSIISTIINLFRSRKRSFINSTSNISPESPEPKKKKKKSKKETKENAVNNTVNESVLDLSYSDKVNDDNKNSGIFNVSQGDSVNEKSNITSGSSNGENNSSDGESDLSNFFK